MLLKDLIEQATLFEDLQTVLETVDLQKETVSFIKDILVKIETGYYDRGPESEDKNRLMFDSGTPVEIKCPVCGRIQVVDLYFWQVNQSWWRTGHLWQKMHPLTCGSDHPSAEMVPAWEDGDDDVKRRVVLVSRSEYHEIIRIKQELLNESYTSLLLIPDEGEEADFCSFQGSMKFFHNAEPVLLTHIVEGKTPDYLNQKGIIFRWVA